VLGRHAQHVRDDHHGQRIREVRHNVDSAPTGGPVEQHVGELADLRLELPDAPRRKRAAHQPAEPGVDWRIGEHHTRRVTEDADALFEEWRARGHT
jgi:hypothetical protein